MLFLKAQYFSAVFIHPRSYLLEMLLLLALNGCSISKLTAMEIKNVAQQDCVSQARGTGLTNSCAQLNANQLLPCGFSHLFLKYVLSILCKEQMCTSNIWCNQKSPEEVEYTLPIFYQGLQHADSTQSNSLNFSDCCFGMPHLFSCKLQLEVGNSFTLLPFARNTVLFSFSCVLCDTNSAAVDISLPFSSPLF